MSKDFQVRPFAFMRLTHEAIRDGVARCLTAAEEGDFDGLRAVFNETKRGIDAHATIENRAFFPMLDERFDGVCEQAGFTRQHVDEEARHTAILGALDSPATDRPDLAALVRTWQEEVEQHLVQEEELMMPLTRKVADTAEGRAQAVRTLIDSHREEVEAFLVPWVAERLEATKPFGPVRMFAASLRVAHAEGERGPIEQSLRRGLSPQTAAKLEQVGALG